MTCDRCDEGQQTELVPKGFPVIECGAVNLCEPCIKYMAVHGIQIGDEKWPLNGAVSGWRASTRINETIKDEDEMLRAFALGLIAALDRLLKWVERKATA
jgi:hypothetical protein